MKNKIENMKLGLPEIIASDIEERIKDKEWEIGDKLPSETHLSEEYQVTRNTIRTALNRVSARGLIDIVNGSGSYVKKLDLSVITDLSADYILSDDTMDEFIEFRRMIEKESVRLFFEKYDSSKIDSIEQILLNFIEYLKEYEINGPLGQDFIENALEFEWQLHSSIVKLSENIFLIEFYNLTRSHLKINIKRIIDSRVEKKSIEGYFYSLEHRHKGLIKALRSKDFLVYCEYVDDMISFNA